MRCQREASEDMYGDSDEEQSTTTNIGYDIIADEMVVINFGAWFRGH